MAGNVQDGSPDFGVYSIYARAVSLLREKDATGTPEVPAPVVHEGGRAMLPHNLIAGIGKETDTDTDIPTHSTTETETKTKTNRDGRGRGRERERERQQKIPRSFIAPPPFYGLRTLVGRRPAVRRKPHKSGRRPRARSLAGSLAGGLGW